MAAMIEPSGATGRICTPECPGALVIATGSPLVAYRTLSPGDDLHADFSDAWREQAKWDRATHFAYWRVALRVWPRADGQVRLRELLGSWVWSWRRCGLSDEQIADRLGRELESLRRRGALSYADELARPRERQWERAPLVVAIERERVPHQFDMWTDPRLAAIARASIQRYHEEIVRLTGSGSRRAPSVLEP